MVKRKRHLDKQLLLSTGGDSLLHALLLRLCVCLHDSFIMSLYGILGSVTAFDKPLGCGRFTEEFIEALKSLYALSRLLRLLTLLWSPRI
ncbi:hypothetical protein BDA96_05G174000 [Sorghum bicolor]|uniref:Uncharacterized protein n=2 Tax=Sorghum bicolor TaxID=4558 RepID=A0A921QYH8_SORBI|nr:hypothetical protein BDA96_05G174000 [Sorghum bicolor]KXG28736.1 hypothetical protein SORBI_3005G160000 [Sorghum bicolor]